MQFFNLHLIKLKYLLKNNLNWNVHYSKSESDPNPLRKKRFQSEPESESQILITFGFGYYMDLTQTRPVSTLYLAYSFLCQKVGTDYEWLDTRLTVVKLCQILPAALLHSQPHLVRKNAETMMMFHS